MYDGDYEHKIEIQVYPRPYFETNDELCLFQFFLRFPYGGAELGYHKTVLVRYFDDEKVFDAEFSYPTLNSFRVSTGLDAD